MRPKNEDASYVKVLIGTLLIFIGIGVPRSSGFEYPSRHYQCSLQRCGCPKAIAYNSHRRRSICFGDLGYRIGNKRPQKFKLTHYRRWCHGSGLGHERCGGYDRGYRGGSEGGEMTNRILNKDELAKANTLLVRIRSDIDALAGGDKELRFAYNRKVSKMLVYDERDGPMERRKVKAAKRREQKDLCARCSKMLPEKYAVLDRLRAADRYTMENTRVLCEPCDRSHSGRTRLHLRKLLTHSN